MRNKVGRMEGKKDHKMEEASLSIQKSRFKGGWRMKPERHRPTRMKAPALGFLALDLSIKGTARWTSVGVAQIQGNRKCTVKPAGPICSQISFLFLSSSGPRKTDHSGFMSVAAVWVGPMDGADEKPEGGRRGEARVSLPFSWPWWHF